MHFKKISKREHCFYKVECSRLHNNYTWVKKENKAITIKTPVSSKGEKGTNT